MDRVGDHGLYHTYVFDSPHFWISIIINKWAINKDFRQFKAVESNWLQPGYNSGPVNG